MALAVPLPGELGVEEGRLDECCVPTHTLPLGTSSNSASIKWNKNDSDITKDNVSIGQITITFSVISVRICGEIKPPRQLLILVRSVYRDRHCYLFLEI